MMKNVIYILIFFIGFTLNSTAQNVRLMQANGGNSINHMTALDLFQFGIESTSTKDENFKIRVSLESVEHGRIGQIITSDFSVRLGYTNGTTIFSNSSISKNENTTNSDFFGFSKLSYIYPAGQYSYCIELLSVENNIVDQFCTNVELINAIELLLIYPFDEEKLTTDNPVFSWTPVITGNAVNYRIRWFESSDRIDQANKLFSRRPFQELEFLNNNMLPYSDKYPEFEKGKYYYWQVEAFTGSTIIAKSEIWKFSFDVSERVVSTSNHYVDINNANAIHRFSGNDINFFWQNRYDEVDLEYIIKSDNSNVLTGTLTGMEIGNNYLTIDGSSLSTNTLYTLTITSAKKSYNLRMMKI